jgi:sigma-B regulation protein RsbU (phosphoserine phosphatase)
LDHSLEREFEIARRIQASFLPEELPCLPGWEIAARFQPARQVSGDFYDVFPLVQNRRLGLVIGDVCDKGVGAALFMALFRTLMRAFAQQHYALRWMGSLSEALCDEGRDRRRPELPSVGTSALKNAIELTNEYIATTHASATMFATLFFGVLDPENGSLLFVNGGHELPALVGPNGIKERLATTGPLVGVLRGARFEIEAACIEPGDVLLAWTDGVTDALNAEGEMFGGKRLAALLAQPAGSAAELLDRIQTSVQAHTGAAEQADDITLLAVKRLGSSA